MRAAIISLRGAPRRSVISRACRTNSSATQLPSKITDGLVALRGAMDDCIVGHEATKTGILLALIAKEHVYIEGPPGTGKTLLAEAASSALGLDFFFYQMHRDTRLAELIGDMVVLREEDAASKGEIIRTVNRPGGILTSQIAVLDDISRAPGEALNVLLRLLNERQFHGARLPLLSVIATGNPPGQAYYNEPLDPANLDRFAIQLQTGGLVADREWHHVAEVIAQYEASGEVGLDAVNVEGRAPAGLLGWCNEALPGISLPEPVSQGLVAFLKLLVGECGLDNTNAILSDRSFLVKAVRLIKANAVLQGRCVCESADLHVLSFMTTFRIPEESHRRVSSLVNKAIASVSSTADRLDGSGPTDQGKRRGSSPYATFMKEKASAVASQPDGPIDSVKSAAKGERNPFEAWSGVRLGGPGDPNQGRGIP